MELLPTLFLQTAQTNLPVSVIFPSFLLLIIISAILKFILNLFDKIHPFKAFRPSNFSQTIANSSTQSSSSGHMDLISLDSASTTMINNRELNLLSYFEQSCSDSPAAFITSGTIPDDPVAFPFFILTL